MNSKQQALFALQKLILSTPDQIAEIRPGELIWRVAGKASDLADEGLIDEAYCTVSILLVSIASPMADDNAEIACRLVENINDCLPKENLQ